MQESTKDIIYAETRRLFSERGYTGTSMRDIAEAVGIKGASLYSHISGKEELLWDMVMSVADRFRESVLPLLEAESPAVSRLRDAVTAHISVITENIESATIYFHEWQYLSPARKEQVLARRDSYEGAFRRVIQQGIDNGTLKTGDAKYASIMLLSSINAIYTWYRPGGPVNAPDVAAMYAELFLRALTPTNGTRKQAVSLI